MAEIRRITFAERQLVIDLFDRYRVFYKQPSDKNLAEAFIGDRLKSDESVIYVAVLQEDGKTIPVGFTQLYPKYSSVRAVKNWILNDLFVDAGYRKQGIGEQLINTAIGFARQQQARFVQLETAVDNYTAQKLYEAIGFAKQEPETGYLVYRINI